jgi:hypothetical protein
MEKACLMPATSPLAVRCPRCGARPDQPCRGMPPDLYHQIRQVRARNAERDDANRKRINQEWLKP